jgi:hypothetical protein
VYRAKEPGVITIRSGGSSLRLLLPGCFALLIFSQMACVQPTSAGSSTSSIDWLWQTPPDEARVELRITSVDAAGKRQIAEITLQYSHYGDGSYVTVTIAGKDQPDRVFCLRCDAANELVPCDAQFGSFPWLRDEFVPGTLMPWHAMLICFCRQFRALKMEQLSDWHRDVVELLPLGPNGSVPKFKLRVFFSKATQLPEEVVHLDGFGREQSTVKIHEIRKTKWGRAVTRSTYHDVQTRARVLIEVRTGSVNKLHVEEGGPRQPSIGAPSPRRNQP